MSQENDKSGFKLKPLEGHLIIRVEDLAQDRIGNIVLPQVAKGVRRFIGVCVASTCFKAGKTYELWIRHKRVKTANTAGYNGLMDPKRIVGMKIVSDRGRSFKWVDDVEYADIRFEHVALILLPDSPVDVKSEDAIERCRWCPTAGEGNMLMDNHGYCIRCGRNSKGEKRSDRDERKVSRRDVEMFGFTAEEYARMQDPKRKRESSRGISYAGQRSKDNTAPVETRPIREDDV